MHRRPVLCLVITALALATGMALFGTALTIGTPRVADPRPVATEEAAHAFYDAVNETIRRGDAAALDAVAADNVTITGAVAVLASDRAGLARYLASVHAFTPQLELVVERVIAVQDRAIVHLVVRGTEEARFLGNPLYGGLPSWGTVEALTVEGGRVVEYMSGASSTLLWEPLGETGLPVPVPLHRIVTLDRLSIPPGGAFTAHGDGETRLLVGEAGSVTVTSPQFPRPQPLSAGAPLTLPNWSTIEIRNDGQMTASVLVLTAALPETDFDQMGSSAPPTASPERGSTPIDWQAGQVLIAGDGGVAAPLAGGVMTTLPAEHLMVSVGRLTLTPGAVLPRYETSGPQILSVDQGILGIDPGEGATWIQRGAEGHSSALGAARLGAGDGATLDTGAIVALDNPGPAPVVVTIVTFLPDDAAADGVLTSGWYEG